MTNPLPHSAAVESEVLSTLTRHPNWPIPGVNFADLSPVYANPGLLKRVIKDLAPRLLALNPEFPPTHIVGLDARGFILGTGLALELDLPFVMIRKSGKSPGSCHGIDYALEYGKASAELQKSALPPNARVIIADDLLATGGTIIAAMALVEMAGAEVLGAAVIIEIPDLGARVKLGIPVSATATI